MFGGKSVSLYVRTQMPTNRKFKKLLQEWLARSDLGTMAALATAARVPVSNISMVVSGARSLPRELAERLAGALAATEDQRERLVEKMVACGQRSTEGLSRVPARRRTVHQESVVTKIGLGKKVNVGIAVSEPFVTFVKTDAKRGFAVELFDHLANLMGILDAPRETLEFKDLRGALKSGKFDIVVTAVLPTFDRTKYMSFSRPLPYLGIPLSAIVRTGLCHESGVDLEADHLLSPGEDVLKRLPADLRLLLVKGEAGDEFTQAFLDADLKDKLKPQRVDDLQPAILAETLLKQRIDLFIADVGTCHAVLSVPAVSRSYKPIAESEQTAKILPPIELGANRFPRLAVYRIAFGLKKDDIQWKQMVDQAFDSMMTEGIRALLSLYRKYLARDTERNSFVPFLMPDDDTVQPIIAREAFESLPEIRTLRAEKEKRWGKTELAG